MTLTEHHQGGRRDAIVRLLADGAVRRQQDLVRLLRKEGYAATQSSISRDLREIGVLKARGRYALPPEQTVALTDSESPAYLPGFFQIALGSVIDSPSIVEKARSGEGFGWHEHVHDVHEGCERFFRPGYNAHLIGEWLPGLDGVVEKLERGALVADAGCGHGASTILMAMAFPNSTFVGSDYHEGSIETARKRAQEAGLADRVSFQVAPAAGYSGTGYDLVTMFDCLHDMGDPVGAAKHVRSTLKPDGTWMIVEPNAGDRVEDNFNPVGRAYYAFSTLLCTPASLARIGP